MLRIRLLCYIGIPVVLAACNASLQELLPVQTRTDNQIPTIQTGTTVPAAQEQEPRKNIEEILATLAGEVAGTGAVRLLPGGAVEFGMPNAPHTLTVFTEYHCTYCNEFHAAHMPKISEEFMETELLKVRFAFLPLQKYPNSESAIRGIICAGKQGQAEAMHRLLTERQSKHRTSAIAYAEEIGVDRAAFGACLEAEETASAVERHRDAAQALDVSLLPTFFLDGNRITGLPVQADMLAWIRGKVQ